VSAAGHLALAVILAWLMPWQAVRTMRGQDKVIGALVDSLARQCRQREAAPKRHLRVVSRPAGEAAPYTGRHLKGVPRRQ
jgi:hypothetical protein